MKQLLMYMVRWQMSTPILAICVYLMTGSAGTNSLKSTIIANLIGSVIFFKVDKFIFNHKNKSKN